MKAAFFVLPILLWIASCAVTEGERVHVEDVTLTPEQVNSDPERWNGRSIQVVGYVLLSSNSHSIYESKELFEEFEHRLYSGEDFSVEEYDKYCLTIANPQELLRDRRRYERQTLKFAGTFVQNYLSENVIDFGACRSKGAIVLERTGR